MELEEVLRHSGALPRPWPGPKVNEFLVSKRFFVAAARAYISNQTITTCSLPKLSGIMWAFARHMRIYPSPDHNQSALAVKDLPMIKTLELCVDGGTFSPLLPKVPWKDIFTQQDIERSEHWDELVDLVKRVNDFRIEDHTMGGLSELSWSAEDPWEKNLMMYEQSLRPFVGLARQSEMPKCAAGEGNFSQAPLYPESAILWQREGSLHGHETANTGESGSTIDVTKLSYGARKDILKRLIESDARLAARMLKDHVEERSHAEQDKDEEVVFAGRGFTGLHWLGKVIEDLDLEQS